jgi:hypothetical protein
LRLPKSWLTLWLVRRLALFDSKNQTKQGNKHVNTTTAAYAL